MCSRLYLEPQGVSLSFACEPIVIAALRSWQACVLVCELVRDAASHEQVTSIGVKGFAADGEIRCVVFDDGDAATHGATIVDTLVESMGGRVVRWADVKGEISMICFPEAAI